MVGHGMKGRAAALVAAALALGAPLGAMAQQAPVVVPGGAPIAPEDEALWGLAQGRGTADAYRNYLSTFPNGAYAPQARARLGQLNAGSAPISGAPPAPSPATTIPPAPATAPAAVPAPAPDLPAGLSPAEAARAEAQGAGAAAPGGDPAQAETALALTLEDRRAIQARLTLLGHDTRGIDGTFGSGTRRAIRDWQTGRGHAATGYLTAAQAQELRTGTPAPAPAAPGPATGATADSESALGLSATEKRIIQSRLTQLGHDTRGIDGKFGSGTRRAITAWQRAAGVPATGYLTRADADALMNAGTVPVVAPGGTAGAATGTGAGTDAETAAQAELALNLTREDRLAVQRALVAAGHDTRGVDGTFGSGTRRALRDWQTARGAPATGYLTAEQLDRLRGQTTPAAPATPTTPAPSGGASAQDEARLGLDPIARTEVQSRLSALGYDPNGIDGRFGSGTRRAISAWQGDNGLAATGYLNADQLARLRAQRRN